MLSMKHITEFKRGDIYGDDICNHSHVCLDRYWLLACVP